MKALAQKDGDSSSSSIMLLDTAPSPWTHEIVGSFGRVALTMPKLKASPMECAFFALLFVLEKEVSDNLPDTAEVFRAHDAYNRGEYTLAWLSAFDLVEKVVGVPLLPSR